MQLKYMGSKSWLAPHVDRLLGDVAVLHSPFFGSGKLPSSGRRTGLWAQISTRCPGRRPAASKALPTDLVPQKSSRGLGIFKEQDHRHYDEDSHVHRTGFLFAR